MNTKSDATATASSVRPSILVIDDTRDNLTVIGTALQSLYRVGVAMDGRKGLEIAKGSPRPDLILLDVMMPVMDGYQVLAELQKDPATRQIPVIFVTALAADADQEKGLELGAVDYITKPIHASILLARVKTHLGMKSIRDQLRVQNIQLELKVQERTDALKNALERAEAANASLRKTYFGVLRSFGELAELRGGNVGPHSQRVADLARQVALRLGMSDAEIQDVLVAALLHDIGMIGLPDAIYQKSVSAMTGEELLAYRQHPVVGASLITKIETMASIAHIVEHHHEHYDGSGFPLRISGLEIPLGSRIILAVSDYDSLKHGKLTASAFSPKQSFQYLLEQRGKRYDPMVVDILEPLLVEDENFEIDEVRIEALHLQHGMVTSRDILHPDGFLLLSKSTVVNQRTIDQLVDVERHAGVRLEIFVNRQRSY